MRMVETTADLRALCEELAHASYIALDTEFMRDQTYWPKLCLIQIAVPDNAAMIDPLAPDIDLSPFYDLLRNPHTVKVFHAARQDVEIFCQQGGVVPTPLFDTQLFTRHIESAYAAMYERYQTGLPPDHLRVPPLGVYVRTHEKRDRREAVSGASGTHAD